MDGFKNTTKTSYDTTSGRKFANGGMTVSRADMPGGEGPMNKPALVAKYAKGGHVKMREGGMMDEGVSTRPTTASGRRMTNEELGMVPGGVERGASLTESERRALARRMFGASATKGEIKALRDKTAKGMSDLERARMMVRPLPRKEGGGVPAHSDRPMKKNMGGRVNSKLSSMITQTKANMAAGPRAKSTFVDTMKKVGPQKPSSGNPLMGGMNRGDIVASKPTPVRGPSMAPAHSNRPMIRRNKGGLSAMPKGGKC
jgi:hypothetical protein